LNDAQTLVFIIAALLRDVASSGSASPASTRPWLRWLRVVLMEDRSLAVAAGCPWRSILNGWMSWQPG